MDMDEVVGERSHNNKTSDDIEANDSFDLMSDLASDLSVSHSLSPFDKEQLASLSPIVPRRKRSRAGLMEAPERPIFSPRPVKRQKRPENDNADPATHYQIAQRNLGPQFDRVMPRGKKPPTASSPPPSPSPVQVPRASSPPRQDANASMSAEASPLDKTVPASPVSPLQGRMMTYMRHVQQLRFADMERFAAMHPRMFRDCSANYIWTCSIVPILSALFRAADARMMHLNVPVLTNYVRIIRLLRDTESVGHMIDHEHFGYMQVSTDAAEVINNNRRPDANGGVGFNLFNFVNSHHPIDILTTPITLKTCEAIQQWCFLYDHTLITSTAGLTWGSPVHRENLLINLAVLQTQIYGLVTHLKVPLC